MVASKGSYKQVNIFKQVGTFMLLTLVVIALLASLSLIGMQNTIQSTKFSQSYLSQALAFQRAQIAIALGEAFVRLEDSSSTSKNYQLGANNKPLVTGLYPQFITVDGDLLSSWQAIEKLNLWYDDNYTFVQKEVGKGGKSSKMIAAYIVEKLILKQTSIDAQYYRITANGVGLTTNSEVVLQTLICITANKQRVSWQKIR